MAIHGKNIEPFVDLLNEPATRNVALFVLEGARLEEVRYVLEMEIPRSMDDYIYRNHISRTLRVAIDQFRKTLREIGDDLSDLQDRRLAMLWEAIPETVLI